MEILNKSFLMVNCNVNIKVTFNTNGDPGHHYLTVKAQSSRNQETFGSLVKYKQFISRHNVKSQSVFGIDPIETFFRGSGLVPCVIFS